MLRSLASSSSRSAVGSALRQEGAPTRMLTSSAVALNKSSPNEATPPSSASASTSQTPTSTGKPLVRESSSSPEQLNTLPLPYLSFAIGVPTPPSSSASTWAETRDRLVSTEHRMASRQAIVKEATRGYFHDFHAIKSHGGKTWRAPPTLIKADRSLYFPKFTGTRLSDKSKTSTPTILRNKISIISLLGSKISEEHTKSFYSPTIAKFSGHPNFQLVQINLQQNPLKSYLVSLFISSLRSQIPPELHPTYLLSSDNIELLKDALGYHNKHVGYTYLVDEVGKVRWAGGGFAEDKEREALLACTGVLLERFGVGEKGKKK